MNNNKKKKSLLFFAPNVPSYICGTTIHTLNELDGLYNRLPLDIEITICMRQKAIDCFNMRAKYPKCKVCTEFDLEKVYDIALVPFHIYASTRETLPILDQVAKKWIMWPLDSIYLEYVKADRITLEKASARQCIDCLDAIIFSSNEAREDMIKRFPECKGVQDTPTRIIPIVGNFAYDDDKIYDMQLPFDEFILIMGNQLAHKRIPETIDIVKGTNNNYIVVGAKEEGTISDNIYGYPSGGLSDELMENLYARCEMLLFPSVYEGFGLPVVEALNFGKNVIAYECGLNHELENLSKDFKGHIYYFEDHEQIPRIIEKARSNVGTLRVNSYDRTWEDVADDIIELIYEVSGLPVDDEIIEKRHYIYESVDYKLFYRHKTLVNIVSTYYAKCIFDGVIDIYGFGVNGKAFYNAIKDISDVGIIIDRKKLDIKEDVESVTLNNYNFEDGHLVVVTPEYEFGKIKKDFCKIDSRFSDSIICVSDFIDEYIIGEE